MPYHGLSPTTIAMFESVGFEPYPEQLPILCAPEHFVLVAGGVQGGKSLIAEKMLWANPSPTSGGPRKQPDEHAASCPPVLRLDGRQRL